MDRLYRIFSSPRLALFLLLTFAVAMAVATFVENDFGTSSAWQLIYDALWFEIVMLGLGLCFATNIIKYRLWSKEKWPILLFHIAFIIILLGAAVTRYTSTAGVMRIREGTMSSTIISTTNYFQAKIIQDADTLLVKKQVDFSPLTNNAFTINVGDINISLDRFIADAEARVNPAPDGKPLLELVVASEYSGRETIVLGQGEIETIGIPALTVGFDTEEPTLVQFSLVGDSLLLICDEELNTFDMSTQEAGSLAEKTRKKVQMRTLHRTAEYSFVPLAYYPKGKFELVSGAERPKDNDKTKDDALIVTVSDGNQKESVSMLYREGFLPTEHSATVGDKTVVLSYGSEAIPTPFNIQLDDFQLERYPGSTSPSSYASEVTVVDDSHEESHRIFMNNVLDYRGYRFYQASYDTDELGTVLAVNQDRPGTIITYIGYFLMGLGMFFTLFWRRSRFHQLNQKLKALKKQAAILALLLFASLGVAQEVDVELPLEEIVKRQAVDARQAEQFGRLLVQDLDGRIKPINTLASELLRKLTRKPYFKNEFLQLTADQAFMAMHIFPNDWQKIPVIKVDVKKGGELLKNFKPNADGLVTFQSLLGPGGRYLLAEEAEMANLKKPAERNEFDKEVLKVDERFNILYNVLSGAYLKIFPNKNDANDTWFAPNHHFTDFTEEDGAFAKHILPTYFANVIQSDLPAASEKLDYIKTYQTVLAADIIPSEKRINAELWYNKVNLNFWLFQVFFTLGFVLLLLAVFRIFGKKRWSTLCWNAMVILVLVSFLLFTGNILLRWYVAQHAPWSNGYEMLVFVSWVLVLCGLLTFRKSDFALPLATLFSGALLFVSYLDWLNPEITNLMPVLKSYWLKVHVATIVSSYAPLALSAVLGMMALILMVFKSDRTVEVIDIRIKELTYINEISMTIGLFVLALGTFLGGVWANESWGRYWAWDPKETWALISIIVYAIVLHLRFVPKWNNPYVLNMASMFAFWSIIMTSFGVNYYLAGLHSYAAGDPLPIPSFVYVLAASMIALAIVAYLFYKRRKSLA